jgi:hypothetical protein
MARRAMFVVVICILASSVCIADTVYVVVSFPDISKEDAAGKTIVRKAEVAEGKYLVFTCEYSAEGQVMTMAIDYEDKEFYAGAESGRIEKRVKARTTEAEEIEFVFEWSVKERKGGKRFELITALINPPAKPEYAGKEESFLLKDTEGRQIEIKARYTR